MKIGLPARQHKQKGGSICMAKKKAKERQKEYNERVANKQQRSNTVKTSAVKIVSPKKPITPIKGKTTIGKVSAVNRLKKK